MTKQIENVAGGADEHQEFCLINSMIQIILESRTKIVSAFKQIENTSISKTSSDIMRYCISGLSKREVTV
jgi:hypothetical protein